MNYRRLSDNELASFARNILIQLDGTELAAINPAVRTELISAFGTLPDDLRDQKLLALIAEGERMASVSIKNGTRERILALVGRVRNALVAGVAPQDQFDLCGFTYRDATGSPYQAQDPTELSVIGYSNNTNKLSFKGNNDPRMVVYEIWRRQGAAGVWTLHGTTTKQSFTDMPVVPGRHYEYKVRAKAARTESNFSNVAVVYGMGL